MPYPDELDALPTNVTNDTLQEGIHPALHNATSDAVNRTQTHILDVVLPAATDAAADAAAAQADALEALDDAAAAALVAVEAAARTAADEALDGRVDVLEAAGGGESVVGYSPMESYDPGAVVAYKGVLWRANQAVAGAAPAVIFRGNTYVNVGFGASATPAFPAGSQAGDVALLFISSLPQDNNTEQPTPAGWTRVFHGFGPVGGNLYRHRLSIFRKTLTAADITAGNVSVTGMGTNYNQLHLRVYGAAEFVEGSAASTVLARPAAAQAQRSLNFAAAGERVVNVMHWWNYNSADAYAFSNADGVDRHGPVNNGNNTWLAAAAVDHVAAAPGASPATPNVTPSGGGSFDINFAKFAVRLSPIVNFDQTKWDRLAGVEVQDDNASVVSRRRLDFGGGLSLTDDAAGDRTIVSSDQVEPWTATTFAQGESVIHRGSMWQASAAAAATDEPGVFPAVVSKGGNDVGGVAVNYVGVGGKYQGFVVGTAAQITRLGVRVHSSGTAPAGSTISLLSATGTVLATGTLVAQAAANSWAYVDIAPTMLEAGTTYRITTSITNWGLDNGTAGTPSGIVSAMAANDIGAFNALFELLGPPTANPWRRLAGVLVQEEGVDLPARSRLNFLGAMVTAADDAAGDRTNITVTPGFAERTDIAKTANFTLSNTEKNANVRLQGTMTQVTIDGQGFVAYDAGHQCILQNETAEPIMIVAGAAAVQIRSSDGTAANARAWIPPYSRVGVYRTAQDTWLIDVDRSFSMRHKAETASFTLARTHSGRPVEVNSATAVNVTIPQEAASSIPEGTEIEFIQVGAGAITFVPASGDVTIVSPGGRRATNGPYDTARLRKRAYNSWLLTFGGFNPSHARVSRTTNTPIPDVAWTSLPWENEVDDDGGHWAAGAPTIVTAALPGLYSLKFSAVWAGSVAGNFRLCRLVRTRGGFDTIIASGGASNPGFPAGGVRMQAAADLRAQAGDTFRVDVYQDSGGALDIAAATENAFFTITRLA